MDRTKSKDKKYANTSHIVAGERLVDRVERDSGVNSTYSQSGNTVTVTCSSPHGLSTGNQVFLKVTSGNTKTGLYKIIVTSTMNLQLNLFQCHSKW